MIIVKLMGGLGNQMFQWAYGKSLSEKYNTPLYLDISFYQNQAGNTQREFSLNSFPFISYNLIPPAINTSREKIIRVVDNCFVSEFNYNKNYDYYLDGYWQSEKYFISIEKLIRKELRQPEKTLLKLKDIVCEKTNNVSIHVRRADYITSNGYHPVQSVEYYKRALDVIGDYDKLFIFSDDISWCRSNLDFKEMIFIDGLNSVENIWLMSMCKHNIIANSSFSWWGAWLNENIDKKVIAPSNWGQQIHTQLPEKWLIVQS